MTEGAVPANNALKPHIFIPWSDGEYIKYTEDHEYVQCNTCADYICFICTPDAINDDCPENNE